MSDLYNWNDDDDGGAFDHETLKLFFGFNLPLYLFFIVIIIFYVITFRFLFLFDHSNFLEWRHAPHPTLQTSSLPHGLDPETIKKLPTVLYQASLNQDGARECCICLSAFRNGENLKVLPGCDHCFHCECVDNWLQNNTSCPLCRASLTGDNSWFPTILIPEPPLRHP